MTYTTKMTMNELPEAVEAYAASGFDPEAMRPLMELLEKQTDYYQGRFWALADATQKEEAAEYSYFAAAAKSAGWL